LPSSQFAVCMLLDILLPRLVKNRCSTSTVNSKKRQ
jgi:hypothetical protein